MDFRDRRGEQMAVIDADTHVIETEHTWDFMREEERAFRPFVLVPKKGQADLGLFGGLIRNVEEFWFIEGRAIQKRSSFISTEMAEGAREMSDVAGRLAHMDELGVDVHVLYPTLFLSPMTRRPEVQVALYRSYNRWMGDIWRQAPQRLRWAVMLPLMSMEVALEELHWAREHGACAVFMHSMEGELRLSDPSLFPMYREASQLNMPICVHATAGNFAIFDAIGTDSGFYQFKLSTVAAFHDLLMKDIPAKFPDLRWGFVEVSAQWVPYALNDMRLRLGKSGRKWPGESILRENRIYVACQTSDDLSWVLEYVGDDNIVIGSDYGHNDTSSELVALRKLKSSGKVPASSVDKMLGENAKRLYSM
jgi:predicted TIM-barrel fold metal-dependent hydrolase